MSQKDLLPVRLSEEELANVANELCEKLKMIEAAEAEKKEAMATFKATVEPLIAEVKALAKIYREKTELRMVDVKDNLNEQLKTVETIRLDTGEIVSTRKADDDDLQMELIPGAKPPKKRK